jgi:uncharacterized caspase-like protein
VYSQLLVAQQADQSAGQGNPAEETKGSDGFQDLSWPAKQSGFLNYFRTTTEKKRVALVIGNGNYLNNEYDKDQCLKGWCKLTTPLNDAQDMTVALTKLGFSVILAQNADFNRMKEAVDEFVNQLNANTEALFYFSGHGIQNSHSQSLLVPIDARRIPLIQTKEEFEVEFEKKAAIKLNDLLSKMKEKGSPTNIVILDACRENTGETPSQTNASATQKVKVEIGLGVGDNLDDKGQQRLSDGFLIAYATAPGKSSAGGNEQGRRNSLYTQFLLKHIYHPGPYHVIFEKVRQDMMEYHTESSLKTEVGNELRYQLPWESNSLRQTFYFVPRKSYVHGGFQ